MKICKIIQSFDCRPSRYCGLETGTALLLAGGATAATSLWGSQSANDANRQLTNRQMKFSAEEAEKQRKFQRDEWTRQYNMQRDEWYNQLHAYSEQQWQQYLREAQYNSPENQVKRLSQTGLNPSALLGGSGSSGLVSAATGNVSNVGSPAPPSGGSVSGSMASTPSALPMQNITSALPSIGSFIRDLAQASKDNSITPAMVKLLGSQFVGQELQNGWQEINNEILANVKDVKVKQAFQDLENAFCQEALYKAMGKNYDADTLVKKAEEALKQAQKKLTDEQYQQLQFVVQHQFETWSAQQSVMKSEANKNNASAGYDRALAQTENENRKNVIDLTRLKADWQIVENGKNALDFKLKDSTYAKTLELTSKHLVQELVREDLLTSELSAKANLAIKEQRYYELIKIVGPTLEHLSNKQDKAADRLAGLFDEFIGFFK